MAVYLYRCAACGPWEVRRPIGTADPTSACPDCGAAGRRIYTAPMVSQVSRPFAAARLRDEASSDAPEVTTAMPPAARRPARVDPRWQALPRP